MGKEILIHGSHGEFTVDSDSGNVVRNENDIPSAEAKYGPEGKEKIVTGADLTSFMRYLKDNGTLEMPTRIDIIHIDIIARSAQGMSYLIPHEPAHRARMYALVTDEEIEEYEKTIDSKESRPDDLMSAAEWLSSTSDNHDEGELIGRAWKALLAHPDSTPLQIIQAAQTLVSEHDADAEDVKFDLNRAMSNPAVTEDEVRVIRASLFALNLPGGEPLRPATAEAPRPVTVQQADIIRRTTANPTAQIEHHAKQATETPEPTGPFQLVTIPAPPCYADRENACTFEARIGSGYASALLIIKDSQGIIAKTVDVPAGSDTMEYLKRRAALMRAVDAVSEFVTMESDDETFWDNGYNQLDGKGTAKAVRVLLNDFQEQSRRNHPVMWFVEREKLLAGSGVSVGDDIQPTRAECLYNFLITAPDALVEKAGLHYGEAEADISENASRIAENIIEGGVKPETGWTRDRRNPFAQWADDGTFVKVAFTARSGERYEYEGEPAVIMPVLAEVCPNMRHASAVHKKIMRDDYAIVKDLNKACALQSGVKI